MGQKKKFDVARPIHVSNSHTKFGSISSSGLGDSITNRLTDGQTAGRTDRGDYNIPLAFFKKSVGIIKYSQKVLQTE